MKKLILGLLLLLTSPVFAQWDKVVVKGDELKGTSDGVNCVYSDDYKHIAFNEESVNYFVLITDKSFFNFGTQKGTNGNYITVGLTGLYDNQDKLIEKFDVTFEVMEIATKIYPNKYTSKGGNNLKRSKKIIDYLKNEKGYVRFILPLHDGSEFDLKVPTFTTK